MAHSFEYRCSADLPTLRLPRKIYKRQNRACLRRGRRERVPASSLQLRGQGSYEEYRLAAFQPAKWHGTELADFE
jgi:hypothetical protein